MVTQTIAYEGDGVWKEYAGGYNDWLRASRKAAKAVASAPARETSKPAKAEPAAKPEAAAPRPAKAKLSYKESRELAELPNKVETLEKEQAGIAAALGDGSVYRDDPARAKAMNERVAAIELELEKALERWAELESK